MATVDLSDDKCLQELKELNTTDLHDAVKKMKVQVDRRRTENLWMESFLKTNVPPKISMVKKQITFDSKLLPNFSMKGSQTIMKSPKIEKFMTRTINTSVKTDLCEQEIKKFESEIKKRQKQSLQEIKKFKTEVQEAEISCKEFNKGIREFEKFVIKGGFDPIVKRISSEAFINFLKDSSRKGAAIKESIRLKTQIMKSKCIKQKKLLMKSQELKSCFRPVDFELAMIEKKKFQQMSEEKQNHYEGLRKNVHSMTSNKNMKQKHLLEASLQLDQLKKETKNCEQLIKQMERDENASQKEVEGLKASVNELDELSSNYEAPSVLEYIEKINELDNLKKCLKSVKRKKENFEFSLKSLQRKYREQLELNKNDP